MSGTLAARASGSDSELAGGKSRNAQVGCAREMIAIPAAFLDGRAGSVHTLIRIRPARARGNA